MQENLRDLFDASPIIRGYEPTDLASVHRYPSEPKCIIGLNVRHPEFLLACKRIKDEN
jgi:hypothetical protein